MIIAFNPPLGETISFTSPSLLPRRQTTPVLFTAQLSAFDYAQIVNDGGHLELWSDIPREGNHDGTWAESRFLVEERPNEPFSGAYILSLGSSSRTSDEQVQNLYLPMALPPTEENGTLQFSFTYRIVYSSGSTTWLGAFGQNGSLVLTAPEPRTLKGIITLPAAWSLDLIRNAYCRDIEDWNHGLEVMKLEHPTDFRVWAFSRNRYLPESTNASVIFFVPNVAEDLPALYPTFVLTTSPKANISVSVDGNVNASGSGNLLLQVNDWLQEPKAFIQKIFRDNDLNGWDILASDVERQLVAFSSPSTTVYPIHVVIIPLWSSDRRRSSLEMEASNLAEVVAKAGVTEFTVIPRNREQVHIFNVQAAAWEKTRIVQLAFDSPGSDFIITPVHRLHKIEQSLHSNWGAAILTHYTTVQAHFLPGHANNLPTPPPSPPLPRAINMSPRVLADFTDNQILSTRSLQASNSILSAILNSEELIENARDPLQNSVKRPEDLNQPKPDAYLHPSVIKGSTSPVPKGPTSHIFRYLFVSFNALVIFFFRFIWAILTLMTRSSEGGDGEASMNRLETSSPINDIGVDTQTKDNSEDRPMDIITPEEHSVDQENIAPERSQDANVIAKSKLQSTEWNSKEPNLLASKSTGLARRNLQLGDAFSSAISDTGANVFYAEILPPDAKATSVDIVLLPLPPQVATGEDALKDEIASFKDSSASFLETAIQGAVTFIDEGGPLICTITQLQSFFTNSNEGPNSRNKSAEQSNTINFISYLVRYQLSWEGENQGRMISISSPLEFEASET